METIIGFAVGYAVGVREGRAGLERLVAACRDIAASPELHRMIAGAASAVLPVARQLASGGGSSLLGQTAGKVVHLVGGSAASGHGGAAHAA